MPDLKTLQLLVEARPARENGAMSKDCFQNPAHIFNAALTFAASKSFIELFQSLLYSIADPVIVLSAGLRLSD
jgi:hypothetical protein